MSRALELVSCCDRFDSFPIARVVFGLFLSFFVVNELSLAFSDLKADFFVLAVIISAFQNIQR